MISLSPPTICNSALSPAYTTRWRDIPVARIG
ncbi:DUF4113 domain-containing protein [Klebsiella quasipneumoniae]